ncbi:MAG: hypothetical protein WC817_05265 [Patescibacteria group bacterium]|jgi:hypothetical protein
MEREREPLSVEEVKAMEEGISSISDLDQEDYSLLNAGGVAVEDFVRLRDKYKNRPDLVNVVNSLDPTHPLHQERSASAQEMVAAIYSDDRDKLRAVLERRRSIFGRKE